MYNLFKIIESKQEDWHKKNPKQKWQTIYDTADAMSKIIGLRFFSDMKVNWYSYTCGVMIFIYFSTVAYTIQFYFKKGEILKGLECTCVIGLVISVCEKVRKNYVYHSQPFKYFP